jgi:predicted dehydrogenase
VYDTGDLFGAGIRVEEFPVCDQYGIQGDLFSRAILEGGEVPTPLEESLRNMAVIDAVVRSSASGTWEQPTSGLPMS